MKKFLLLYLSIFVLEIIIHLLHAFFHNAALGILHLLMSMPATLINRSYPFYTQGSGFYQLLLLLGNILIQTTVIFMILKIITKYRKTNSL